MNLKKNFKVKIGAVIVSLVAFDAGWGLMRQNQPVPVVADAAGSGATSTRIGNGANSSTGNASAAGRVAAPRRHVRTHVS